jgi:hypothetical protein
MQVIIKARVLIIVAEPEMPMGRIAELGMPRRKNFDNLSSP